MKAILAALVLGLMIDVVGAFELKGISPGMPANELDLAGCVQVENADSGIPGFHCDSTIGGDKAALKIVVFDARVVGAIFNVEVGHMGPVKDALSQKFGTPDRPNRYMEKYLWSRGSLSMRIAERGRNRGYSVTVLDFILYQTAAQANAKKAGKDL